MRPDDGRVVSNFITQALRGEPLTVYGDGTQSRSFCYVSDQISGQLALLDSSYVGPVNIGSDVEFTMLELAEHVRDITNSSTGIIHKPLPQDDPLQRKPDLTIARTELGWEPEVPLRTGLELTMDYFAGML
jgi:nucleoside-diphosphate-sugar epimerase